jgi:hypothetical protein
MCESTRSSLNITWSCGLVEGKGVSTSRVKALSLSLSISHSGSLRVLQGSAALSAPLIAASMLAPDYRMSMALLFPGFMLSEVPPPAGERSCRE